LRFVGTPSALLSCSTRELIRPGYKRPTYAPLVIRSNSVSPGRSASSDLERIWFPKTIARCSLVSTLFLYTCNHISCPVVVGIRARTSHSTLGSCGSRSGRGVSVRTEVSTGMERGGRGCEGVAPPGVAGGVKAGDIIEGGGLWCASSSFATRSGVSDFSCDVWKSKPSRPALERCGEKCGGKAVMMEW
jgi:hypothetical protein